jgi:putative transposase
VRQASPVRSWGWPAGLDEAVFLLVVQVRDNVAACPPSHGRETDGRPKVLGTDIGPSEAEPFWTEFLRKLPKCGLRGVKLVISDAQEGPSYTSRNPSCLGWYPS